MNSDSVWAVAPVQWRVVGVAQLGGDHRGQVRLRLGAFASGGRAEQLLGEAEHHAAPLPSCPASAAPNGRDGKRTRSSSTEETPNWDWQ